MPIQLKPVMDLILLNFESFSVFLRPVVLTNKFLNWFFVLLKVIEQKDNFLFSGLFILNLKIV